MTETDKLLIEMHSARFPIPLFVGVFQCQYQCL